MPTNRRSKRQRCGGEAGFSLVEVLTVVAVIAVLGAVGIPRIADWLRQYKLRGAAQQVASEIEAARLRAISKNVNLGVVFVVRSDTTFQFAVEDDLVNRTRTRPATDTALDDAVRAGPRRQLPSGITFIAPTGGATDQGLRFSRLGAACDPGSESRCPIFTWSGTAPTSYVRNDTAGSTIVVQETRSGWQRTVLVGPGGRTMIQ